MVGGLLKDVMCTNYWKTNKLKKKFAAAVECIITVLCRLPPILDNVFQLEFPMHLTNGTLKGTKFFPSC